MSNFKIKNIVLYSFIVLIIGMLTTSGVLFVLLSKLAVSHKQIIVISDTSNSFKQLKLDTERLLTTTDLESEKKNWANSIVGFEKQLALLPEEKQNKFNDIWYICKKEIPEINELLGNELLTKLGQKPLLMIRGEMFALKEKTEYYRVILSLSKKIEYLIEYEDILYKDITKILNREKYDIDRQIGDILDYSIFFIPFISTLMVIIIFIMNKNIVKIENKLLISQENLKENNTKLEDARLLLQNIIDSVPASIFWKDTKGVYLGLNQAFVSNTNFNTIDEIIGKTDFDMPWKDSEAENYRLDDVQVIKNGKAKLLIEETLTKDDGSLIYVITSKVPLKNTQGEIIGVLGIFMDVTETKKMYDELAFKDKLLAQQSKMAAMGEMLENIAHQWRQPLSFISVTAGAVDMKKEIGELDDEYLSESLNNIIKSVEHLNQTIEDFRSYFKEDRELKLFGIGKVMDKALFLVQSKLKNRSIKIVRDLDDVEFYGLENEFIQVIMNIFSNAIDAFDEIDVKNKVIFIESHDSADYTELRIKDNAGGIPEDIIKKVFDPYFTTKGEDKGTGIGLYMSKDMIEKHMKGSISVSNQEFNYENNNYKGTEFILHIPKDIGRIC